MHTCMHKFPVILQGSEEEGQDVLKAYVEAKGKMSTILDSVMLATAGGRTGFNDCVQELQQFWPTRSILQTAADH